MRALRRQEREKRLDTSGKSDKRQRIINEWQRIARGELPPAAIELGPLHFREMADLLSAPLSDETRREMRERLSRYALYLDHQAETGRGQALSVLYGLLPDDARAYVTARLGLRPDVPTDTIVRVLGRTGNFSWFLWYVGQHAARAMRLFPDEAGYPFDPGYPVEYGVDQEGLPFMPSAPILASAREAHEGLAQRVYGSLGQPATYGPHSNRLFWDHNLSLHACVRESKPHAHTLAHEGYWQSAWKAASENYRNPYYWLMAELVGYVFILVTAWSLNRWKVGLVLALFLTFWAGATLLYCLVTEALARRGRTR